MMDFRLERSLPPAPPVKIDGVTYKPKRQWLLFGVFPHTVNPSCLSQSAETDRNGLTGVEGAECRVVHAPSGKMIARWVWHGEVMENPSDPESTKVLWGWRLEESGPVPAPERTHFSSYIPSVT